MTTPYRIKINTTDPNEFAKTYYDANVRLVEYIEYTYSNDINRIVCSYATGFMPTTYTEKNNITKSYALYDIYDIAKFNIKIRDKICKILEDIYKRIECKNMYYELRNSEIKLLLSYSTLTKDEICDTAIFNSIVSKLLQNPLVCIAHYSDEENKNRMIEHVYEQLVYEKGNKDGK